MMTILIIKSINNIQYPSELQVNMKKLLRWIGRLLIVTFLLSSTFLKLKSPQLMLQSVLENYQSFKSIHPIMAKAFPSVQAILPYSIFIIRTLGAVEAFISILIIFGDPLAGLLFLSYLITVGMIRYGKVIQSGLLFANSALLSQFVLHVGLMGLAVYICDTGYLRKR